MCFPGGKCSLTLKEHTPGNAEEEQHVAVEEPSCLGHHSTGTSLEQLETRSQICCILPNINSLIEM